jgi:hypothetical protein
LLATWPLVQTVGSFTLSQVRSSRRLERECKRNVEVMWLLRRLAPDFKTIAEFRRTNTDALVAVCAAFVQFARAQRLITGDIVAIDGSKIKAVASKRAVVSLAHLKEQEAALNERIHHYMRQLDEADQTETPVQTNAKAVRDTLSVLSKRRHAVQQQAAQLAQSGQSHTVTTEPEARLMRAGGGPSIVGYNLQTAVDSEHSLIVHHQLCQERNDLQQLWPVASQAKAVLQKDALTVVADAGYSNGAHIDACEQAGITVFVPVQRARNPGGDSLYTKSDFNYDAGRDLYVCPAETLLHRKQVSTKDRMIIYAPRDEEVCQQCTQKSACTKGGRRYISRHFDEEALNRTQLRTAAHPEMMHLRRCTVEHPFGTIKERILGNARLLMRGLKGAKAELSLAVLAYNFKRVNNILGTANMRHLVSP